MLQHCSLGADIQTHETASIRAEDCTVVEGEPCLVYEKVYQLFMAQSK